MIQNERVPTVLLLRKQLFQEFAHDEYSNNSEVLFCKTLTGKFEVRQYFHIYYQKYCRRDAINTT
jgi:predicted lactoylglutathione lyase